MSRKSVSGFANRTCSYILNWSEFFCQIRLRIWQTRSKHTINKAKRQKALRWGLLAERLAGLALRFKGYKILAYRFAVRGGEIDIIAQRGNTIAFIEVKSRRDIMSAAFAIDAAKQRRMSLAAKAWIQAHPKPFN